MRAKDVISSWPLVVVFGAFSLAALLVSGCGDDEVLGPGGGTLVPGRIVFETYRDGNGEIYSMEADGSDPVNLTNNAAYDGEGSATRDGKRIAFASNRDSQLPFKW